MFTVDLVINTVFTDFVIDTSLLLVGFNVYLIETPTLYFVIVLSIICSFVMFTFHIIIDSSSLNVGIYLMSQI